MKTAIIDFGTALFMCVVAVLLATSADPSVRRVAVVLLLLASSRYLIDAARAAKKAWDDSPGVFP